MTQHIYSITIILRKLTFHMNHITQHTYAITTILQKHPLYKQTSMVGNALISLLSSFQHYSDVIMSTIASLITSLTIVYSTVYSDADQRKHQSPASLAFVRGIHRRPVNSPHKWPVTRKMFPFDDVIMNETRLGESLGSDLLQLFSADQICTGSLCS